MTEVYRNTSGSIGNFRSDSKCSEVVPLKAKVKITDNSRGPCASHSVAIGFIILDYVVRETLSAINWRSQLNTHTSSSYIFQSNTYPWSRWTTYRETYNQELNAVHLRDGRVNPVLQCPSILHSKITTISNYQNFKISSH